jgi:predicted permease
MDVRHFLGGCWRDVRYGLRQLRRSPAYTTLAVSALAIGVGANVTVFTFVSSQLLRPIDAEEPSRLVRVSGPGFDTLAAGSIDNEAHITPADYIQYRDRNQTFSALAASHPGGPTSVRWEGPAEMIPVLRVTGNYFPMLGVRAALGRALLPGDAAAGAREAIVLSDAGWHRYFRADPNVVGATVVVDGIPHVVVGVLPEQFTGTYGPMVPQIYRPIVERGGQLSFEYRLQLLGRLKPEASLDQAQADLARVATQLAAGDGRRRGIEVNAARSLIPFIVRGLLVVSVLFGLIVGSVLLLTCNNIAILTTFRSVARSREIALRLALGASRSRIVVQLVLETALVCAAAGVVGTYLALQAARVATQFYAPVPMPFALTFKPDWRVMLFAGLVSGFAIFVCGLVPALKVMKTDLTNALKQKTVPAGVQATLVTTQMALSTLLLVSAAVLANSAVRSANEQRGFQSHGVTMSTIALDRSEYPRERRLALIETLLERVEKSPGVASAVVVANIPAANNAPLRPLNVRGDDGRISQVQLNLISRGLFETLGVPVLAGRDFASADDRAPESIGIVNETLARAFFPGRSPVGEYLQIDQGPLVQIVGLARDSEYAPGGEPVKPFLYRPIAVNPAATPTFLMKAAGDPAAIATLVRRELAGIDPDLVAYNVMALDDRLMLGSTVSRTAAMASGGLGILALALGTVGVYGTIALLVRQRRQEIAVRLALGASSGQVRSLFARQGMAWALKGTAVGLGLAGLASLALSRAVRGVVPGDPVAFVGVSLALLAVAYAACAVPARRASRIGPMTALRED